MKASYIRLGALALILLGVIITVLGAHKTITIAVDGQPETVQVYAFTAGQALNAAGIRLAPEDRISPESTAWIQNGSTIHVTRAALVFIAAGGQVHHFYSAERLPAGLLRAAEIRILPGDVVLVNGAPAAVDEPLDPAPAYRLQVVHPRGLRLNGQEESPSSAPSLAHALWEQGIVLREGDRLSIPALTALQTGSGSTQAALELTLTPSRQIIILTAAGNLTLRTAAGTVGDALAEAGLSPQGLDYASPALSETLPANGQVRLVRVAEQVAIEQAPLPFETEFVADPNTELDSRSVLQAGEYGLSSTRVRIRYEDGVEVERTSDTAWVSRLPVNRIEGYGTQIVMKTITTSDGATIQYWRAIQMYATSYRPLETSNTTASGLPLQKGVCAIDRRYIPFFTQMYIPGYGNCTAADVGGGVAGRWIDLGYSNEDYQSWHQWVTVYFLWPAPAFVAYIFP